MKDHSKHHLLTHEAISKLAHEMYLIEGKPEGREVDHWLEAEQELLRRKAQQQVSSDAEIKAVKSTKVASKPARKTPAKRRAVSSRA